MYGYRKHYHPPDTRFVGSGFGLFALPFLGGLAGGFLGSALYPRPFYGYPGLGGPGSGFGFAPGIGFGKPGCGLGGPGSGFGYAPGIGLGGPGSGFGYAPGIGLGGPGSGFGYAPGIGLGGPGSGLGF
jgi:hypothetical protein